MHPWRVRAVAFTVSATCLGACSATTAPQAPERSSTAELAVTVLQQRVDATTRTVGVDTTNLADHSVHVSEVRLSGGGIDAATTPLDTDLQPGRTVALRTSYGRPDCDDRRDTVVAHLTIDDQAVSIPVDRHGQDEVRRLLDADCARLELAETVSVELSGPYREVTVDEQPRLSGRLQLIRLAPGPPLDLHSLAGSVLIDLWAADGLVDLPASGNRAEIRVLLGSSGRCDAHSLGGSTQTFLLSAYVRLGEAPEQRVILTPTMPVQDRILDVVAEACAGVDH